LRTQTAEEQIRRQIRSKLGGLSPSEQEWNLCFEMVWPSLCGECKSKLYIIKSHLGNVESQ
jgi:hypothetical protein